MASIFILFGILSCFFVQLPLGSRGFICPGPIDPPQGFTYARIESNISGRASQDYEKIRIKIFYQSSIEDEPYKDLVQVAADFFSNVLSVKPVNGRLFKSRDCESENRTIMKDLHGSGRKERYCLGYCKEATHCREIEVPEEHLDGCKYCTEEGDNCTNEEPEPGAGIEDADIVFYVSGSYTGTCIVSSAVAYAGACDLEPVLDRPVFARINVCPTPTDSLSNDSILTVLKHEMMHVLGFDNRLFKYFRDEEGIPLWPRGKDGKPILNDKNVKQNVTKTIAREWHVRGEVIKSERVFLVTPKVKEEAQNHFGCPELEGAELEDYGNSGSRSHHFEARVLYDDAMKSNMDFGKGLFSRIDFAVLDDSGWYQVNYSQAEEMDFGRDLGCDFCMKSCKFWMDKNRMEGKSLDPYCDKPDLKDRRGLISIGSKERFSGCPLQKVDSYTIESLHDYNSFERINELPRKYQHFDQISGVYYKEVPQFGSIDPIADFCPVPLQNADVTGLVNKEIDFENEPRPTKEPEPKEEPKDDKYKGNQSSNTIPSVLLVILFPILMKMVSKSNF